MATCELDSVVLVEEDVFGFDVAVDDGGIPGVQVGDCLDDLPDHLLGGAFIELALPVQLGEELAVGRELEDEVDVLSVVEGVVELNDVVVVELPTDLYLVVQLRYHVLHLHLLLRNALEGELLASLLVHCAIHHSEGASSL